MVNESKNDLQRLIGARQQQDQAAVEFCRQERARMIFAFAFNNLRRAVFEWRQPWVRFHMWAAFVSFLGPVAFAELPDSASIAEKALDMFHQEGFEATYNQVEGFTVWF